MVVKRTVSAVIIISLIAAFLLSLSSSSLMAVEASEVEYRLNYEYAKLWVNQDGTVDLMYVISITCIKGKITYVKVGQPTGDFTIGEATDEEGRSLRVTDVSDGEYYGVKVYLYTPLETGETAVFTLTTNVGRMVWEDEGNPGNVGVLFIPCWWDVTVGELKVAVVLPEGVAKENVKCTPDWDNAYIDPEEAGRLVVYWERTNLKPNEKLSFGVSFPKEYVSRYETRGKGVDWWTVGVTVFGGLIFIVGVGSVLHTFRKRRYVRPTMLMEALGVRRGLTAVEASYLLDLPPTKIVTEILYSLLKKKAVWVTATKPTLRLTVMKEFRDKTGTHQVPLRYYEKNFLKAVKRDGTLDEAKLAETINLIRDTVEDKLRGYCRKDTIAYYRKVVAEAWKQVEQAGTPELASKAYDENLLWILLDEDLDSKTGKTFKDKTFNPAIDWWWYWYIYTHYHPHPQYKPKLPTTTIQLPPIPGSDFANTIATAIENTANNIVSDIEKFTNSVLPPPKTERTSRNPAHHKASCVCACAACACVCACVSCACACASGGVG